MTQYGCVTGSNALPIVEYNAEITGKNFTIIRSGQTSKNPLRTEVLVDKTFITGLPSVWTNLFSEW